MTLKNLVVNPGDDPPAPEVLAQAIVDIAEGMKRLKASRLTRRALCVLLRDSTSVSIADIGRVLDGLESLEVRFLTPARKK